MRFRSYVVRIVALALALVALRSGIAHADERSDARRHFRTGLDLISRQRYADGIAELEAAYAILPHPNVLYNIARAYHDMGNTERAVEYLRRYLQNDVPDRADVEAVVNRLEGQLRQREVAAGGSTGGAGGGTSTPVSGGGTGQLPTNITLPVGTGAGQADVLRATAMQLLRMADQASGGQTTTTTVSTGQGSSGTPPGTGTAAATQPNGAAPQPGATSGATINAAPSGGDTYEEQVVTASRVAQSPLDAPNATAVITAQDIRLSGLTNVPDLLRRVAGVDIMTLDTGDTQVSIRGFNQRLSNKVLVLIDGRSIYLDFLGVTLWPTVFPAVEEIERIEVIRGPGSALYGADAFTGVINIITRPPGENRTQVTLGGGMGQQLRGAFLTSGRQGILSYRASVQYEQRAMYDRPIGDNDLTWVAPSPAGDIGFRAPRFMLDLQARLARDVIVRGGVGACVDCIVNFSATGLLRRFWSQSTLIQPYVQLDAGGFTGRVFWNHFEATAQPLIIPRTGLDLLANVEQDVVDADLQYAARQDYGIAHNTVQIGLGGRMKHISWNYLDADHTLFFFSAYLQDTLRLADRFSLVASARVDRHPVLQNLVFSPRAALIFKPSERRAFRLSGGTAFRTPTMLETYFDLFYPTTIPGLTVLGNGSEVWRARTGAAPLRPESAISGDIGYQDQTLDWLQVELNGFVTRGTDVINLAPVALDPLPGDTSQNAALNVGTRVFANDPGVTYVAGAEVGARFSPSLQSVGLDVFANYTFAYTWHDASSPLAQTPDHIADQRTPMHKFNIGLQIRTHFGLDLEAMVHYQASQVWVEPVFDPVLGTRDVAFTLGDFWVVNARIGWRFFHDRLDLGVVGTNLTDWNPAGGHLEHPFGSRLSARVMGTVSYRF